MRENYVYHVKVGDREGYFSSIAAIFDEFTPKDMGISLSSLWNFGITEDNPFNNRRCSIKKARILGKRQKKES